MTSPEARDGYSAEALKRAARAYGKVVLWGLVPPLQHSHGHVFSAYWRVCQKLGLNAAWLDDKPENAESIQAEDIVFIHGSTNSHIPAVLARRPVIVDFHVDVNRARLGDVVDQVWAYQRRVTERERPVGDAQYWDPLTAYSAAERVLAQPWGTDLLVDEFDSPTQSGGADAVYWIGAWWKDESWGNYDEIAALKHVVEAAGLRFVQFTDCDTVRNRFFVRQSRIAPAIAGAGQVRADYLACRFFKNISYGQPCISNVAGSQAVLQGSAIYAPDVAAAVTAGLATPQHDIAERVRFQQHCIRNYTVAAHLYLILLTGLACAGGGRG